MAFKIKRVYEAPTGDDGTRVLVDRLWPRGLKKSDAQVSLWMKEIAPTPGLRVWFNHDPLKFPGFKRRYALELARNAALPNLRELGKKNAVTLLYAARDPKVNHATVLLDVLRKRGPQHPRRLSRESDQTAAMQSTPRSK
jgi:uncharacterized protein YeaO (DUF488 family)